MLIDKDLWNKRNHPDTASSSESPKVHLKLETAISPSVNIITVGQSAQKVEISGGSSSSGDASRSHQGTQTGPLSPTEVKAASPGSLQLPSSHPITSNAAQSVPIKTPWVPPVYASEAEQEAAELLCYVPKEKLLLLKTIQT